MSKLTLNQITSGYYSTEALNANFDAIEAALEKTLSRDGTAPNTITANVDVNGYRLTNLGAPTSNLDAARYGDVSDLVDAAVEAQVSDALIVQEVIDQVEAAGVTTSAVVEAMGNLMLEAIVEAEDAALDAVSAAAASVTLYYETWTALSSRSTTGLIDGQLAKVASTDSGTHTDPVVGGTVSNAGIYRWSVSPAGWKRLAGLDSDAAADSAAAAAVSEMNAEIAAASVEAVATDVADLVEFGVQSRPWLYNGLVANARTGQSLQVGTAGNPALTTTQAYGNLMLAGGINASAAGGSTASLSPMIEGTYETGAVLCENKVLELIDHDYGLGYNDHNNRYIVSNCAVGNTDIANLSPSNASYNYLLADMAAIVARAAELDRTVRFNVVFDRQGERDYYIGTTADVYKRRKRIYFQMIENDAYRLNPNQDVPLKFIVYQMASHKNTAVYPSAGEPYIALALLDLALDPDLPIFMSNPTYPLTHYSDGVHLVNTSYAKLGVDEGVIEKAITIDKIAPDPLAWTSARRSGTTVTLRYPMEEGTQLVLDTTNITSPGDGKGFELLDDLGAAMTISSVALGAWRDEIVITASATIPVGATLKYAHAGTSASGPTSGPRGCVRDNRGDTIPTTTINGSAYSSHRWAPIQKEVLS